MKKKQNKTEIHHFRKLEFFGKKSNFGKSGRHIIISCINPSQGQFVTQWWELSRGSSSMFSIDGGFTKRSLLERLCPSTFMEIWAEGKCGRKRWKRNRKLLSLEDCQAKSILIFTSQCSKSHLMQMLVSDHRVTVANSPHLNPTDNLWSSVKKKMGDSRSNDADDLKAPVKAS